MLLLTYLGKIGQCNFFLGRTFHRILIFNELIGFEFLFNFLLMIAIYIAHILHILFTYLASPGKILLILLIFAILATEISKRDDFITFIKNTIYCANTSFFRYSGLKILVSLS